MAEQIANGRVGPTLGIGAGLQDFREGDVSAPTAQVVSGDFRDTFDYWHMGRKFTDLPVLNSDFVVCEPTKRIHAVQTEDVLWCMINHSVKARRMVNRSAHSRIE